MNMTFYKYHGTGNDFIIIDNRSHLFPKKNCALIASLCDRHFGIGADGLILLENDAHSDFKMIYFNSDGNESTMCGNGGRCIVAFAKKLELFTKKTHFSAIDGMHHAEEQDSIISLQMINVNDVKIDKNYIFLDTGSPHHVEMVTNLKEYPVVKKARAIQENIYKKEGCNINFVEQMNQDSFKVRTYERGVEGETLACGTGVTAVALAMHATNKTSNKIVKLSTLGGDLEVCFDEHKGAYSNIILSGPATYVFQGIIKI